MTQEEKQLLLKDICARLQYGVKFTLSGDNIYTMKGIDLIVTDEGNWEYAVTAKGIIPIEIEYIKPYLRHISSMTEEELNECVIKSGIADIKCPTIKTFQDRLQHCINWFIADTKEIDWLNMHHFDYRGLIEKGLALEAPEGMYKTE